MFAIDRWRNWRPPEERFDESPGCEPPKPSEPTFEGFEGATSEQMQDFSDVSPEHDPAAWRQDFNRWRNVRCVSRTGYEDSGGIGCLWVDFCEWAIKNNSVSCQRRTFERLLEDAGFPLKDGMTAGLILRPDLEAVLRFQNPPLAAGRKGHQIKPAARKGAC